MKNFLIQSAYFLKKSHNYHKTKSFFYDLLENPKSKLKFYFDFVMVFFVAFSIFFIIYDIERKLNHVDNMFENAVIAVFAIEYLLRAWLYNNTHQLIIDYYEKNRYLDLPFSVLEILKSIVSKKLEYMISPVAIIDLLAIFPSFRPFWFLRILLIFRIFKLFRYYHNIRLFSAVLKSRRFELITLTVFMGFLIFVASIAIYLFEYKAQNSQIETLYDAVYWAIVTISTVGYGDISPHTMGGRLVAMVLILSGLGVLSFFVSIIVNAFSEQMDVLHTNRTYAELERYKNFVIICGFGRVGQEIAWQLKKDRQDFIVIDKNPERIEFAKQHNFLTVCDDAGKNQVLLNAGINRGAATVVCTTGDDVDNVYITLSSRYLNPKIRIISRVNDHNNVRKMLQAGADHIIQPFQTAGLLAAEYVGQPVAMEAILGILQERKHILMDTIVVQAGDSLESKKLIEMDFAKRKLSLVGIISCNELHQHHKNRYPIQDQHFYFNPDQQFQCQEGDILVVLGRKMTIQHFRSQLEKSLSRMKKK